MSASEYSFINVPLYSEQHPCELKCFLKDVFIWHEIVSWSQSLPVGKLWKTNITFFFYLYKNCHILLTCVFIPMQKCREKGADNILLFWTFSCVNSPELVSSSHQRACRGTDPFAESDPACWAAQLWLGPDNAQSQPTLVNNCCHLK